MSKEIEGLKDSVKYQIYGECLACLGYFAINAVLHKSREVVKRELAACTRLKATPELKRRLNWWSSKFSNIQNTFYVNGLNGATIHGLNLRFLKGKGRPSHPGTQARIKEYALDYFLNDLERCKRYAKLYIDNPSALSAKVESALFDVEDRFVNEDFQSDQLAIDELKVRSPEGAKKLVIHLRRERDAILSRDAKAAFAKLNGGRLFCQACGAEPMKLYGIEVTEAHHRTPLSKSEEGRITEIKDLIMLCPSCHRAVHRIPDCDFDLLRAKFI